MPITPKSNTELDLTVDDNHDVFVCGAYNEFTQKLINLMVVLTAEAEKRMRLAEGVKLTVNSKSYVLGEREINKDDNIVCYGLLSIK